MSDYGIAAHRVTIYEDVTQLKDFGVDIYTIKSTQNKYYLASRLFDLPELKLLIDAVESSKFITEKKSRVLSEKLTSLASVNQSSELKRNISITGRIKAGNEQIYYIMDALNAAINKGKKVSFPYFEFYAGKRKRLKNEGVPYVLSPYTLTWNGDNYYVVGWSDKHNKIATFRVDRIYQVPEILSEDAVPKPKKYNIGEFAEKAFQLYDSEHAEVELVCENATPASQGRGTVEIPSSLGQYYSLLLFSRLEFLALFFLLPISGEIGFCRDTILAKKIR